MVPQATPVSEPCTTLVTWKRFFALVRCTNMSRQSIASREQHVTLVACKRCGAPLILAFLFFPFLRLKIAVDATLRTHTHKQTTRIFHTHALANGIFFFWKTLEMASINAGALYFFCTAGSSTSSHKRWKANGGLFLFFFNFRTLEGLKKCQILFFKNKNWKTRKIDPKKKTFLPF